MNTSGERFVPEAGMGIELEVEHLHRYQAVAPFMKGKTVLDAACGAGYGTKILAEYAKHVTGIDLDRETVEHARKKYAGENIAFEQMSIDEMPFAQHSFDAIVSFETIEHVPEDVQHRFLKQCAQLLKPDGILIVSTPDREVFLRKSAGRYNNPYHIKEYDRSGFEKLLKAYFPFVCMHAQERVGCSVIDGEGANRFGSLRHLEQGDYLIAVCSAQETDLPLGSVLLPSTDMQEMYSFFYFDKGAGYTETDKVCALHFPQADGSFCVQTDIAGNGQIRKIRFDPCDFPAKIRLSAVDEAGEPLCFLPANQNSEKDGMVCFMHSDPFYELAVEEGKCPKSIVISGIYSRYADADVEEFWARRSGELAAERDALYGTIARNNSEHEKQISQLSADRDAKKALYRAETEKVSALDAQIGGLKAKAEESERQLGSANAELQQTKERLEAEQNEHRQTKVQLEAEQSGHRQTKAQLEAEQSEHRQTKAQLEAEQSEHRQAKTQLAAELARLTQARAQLESAAAELMQARAQMDATDEQIRQTRVQLDSATAECERLNGQLSQMHANCSELLNSRSWRVTAPLRKMGDVYRALRYRCRKLIGLARRALEVLREDGPKALIEKIRNYGKGGGTTAQTAGGAPAFGAGTCFREGVAEPAQIPASWIEIQRRKPLISVIMAVRRVDLREKALQRAVRSIAGQKYRNIELVIACPKKEQQAVKKLIAPLREGLEIKLIGAEDSADRKVYWDIAAKNAGGELIAIMEQEDVLTENAMAYVLDAANEHPETELFVIPDDRFITEGDYFQPDFKMGLEWGIGGVDAMLHMGVLRNHGYRFAGGQIENWLRGLDKSQIQLIPWICCHGEAVESVWDDAPQVRTLAFYLPQFHAIPENDEWWGKGFTEWVNVKKAAPLYPGHHQPRKPAELGYYDLGDEQIGTQVQKRQMELAKEYGLSGFCYYYYWFDGGKRLLEKPVDRHLNDRSMDFPFCLCWANENWSRRWDGLESEVLMPQTYKEGWAEQFIADMLPYLKDERYIRLNGAPFILIYNMEDIPNAGAALAAWRRIAAENGIERLHISAVRRTLEAKEFELSGYSLDSLTDFPPHLIGKVDIDHSEPERFGLGAGQVKDYRKASKFHVDMPKQNYTYFRAVTLEWDNTARKGKNAYVFEEFSFAEYRKWLYSAKRYAIRQNRDGEDLVFINAWNEWAEGTYLEPSEPHGRTALEETRAALKMR